MSQNYEDIQAQLAAYIDGDLPPGQRAEIEKHLAANPSHKALLGELATHKQVLRRLPRVKAPPDLAEQLLSQLEREQLLADPALVPDRPFLMRLFGGAGLAVAASVALMIGLVAAIYHILPGRPPVAIVTPSPNEEASALPAPDPDKAAVVGAEDRKSGIASGIAPTAPAFSKAIADKAVRMQDMRESETAALTPSAQNVEQVVLAVAAPDVDQANGQVLRFLADNDIAWSVGADAEVQNFRARSYPRVVALTEPARIQEYSRAIAEELKSAGQAEPATTGGFAGGRGGGGAGVGSGPGLTQAPRPTQDAGSQAAMAPSAPRKETSSLMAFGGARRTLKGGAFVDTTQQQDLAGAKDNDVPFHAYTNTLAQANSRTILARGLKASQVEQLALVLDGPIHVQPSRAGRELPAEPAVLMLRGSLQADDPAPGGPANNEKPLADALGKAAHDQPRPALDGVEKRQDSPDRPMRPVAKPAVAMPAGPATQAEPRYSSVATANQAVGAIDRYQKQGAIAEQEAAGQQDTHAVIVPPTTRPADAELYDVLIVLSSAPVAPAAVNAPPSAAAGSVPSTAPASRPMPDAKRE